MSDARIQEVLDPLTGEKVMEVTVPRDLLNDLWDRSPWVYFNSFTARDVLQAPEAVFHGARLKEEDPWGWCYVGVPEKYRSSDNEPVDLPKGLIFAAYVSQDGTLFGWGLELADPREPCLPLIRDLRRFPGGQRWRKED